MVEHTKTMLISRNLANMKVLGEVEVCSPDVILARFSACRSAQAREEALSLSERLRYIEPFRVTLLARQEALARLITSETGKPLVESYGAELFGPLETCRSLQRHAPKLLAAQKVKLNPVFFRGKKSYN